MIGEIHTLWEKPTQYILIDNKWVLSQYSKGKWEECPQENWIIRRSVPMTIQDNVKKATDELNWMLYMAAFWFFGKFPNRINRVTTLTFLCFVIADAGLYFWNYKTYDYFYIYSLMPIVWIYLYKRIKK